MSNLHRINILGTPIDRVSMAGAIVRVHQFIAARMPRLIITPNVDHVIQTRRDAEFKRIYACADLTVPDGVPLLWAAKFLGQPLIERVNGTDLFEALCACGARLGHRVFLLGAAPGVAAQAAENLQRRHPGLDVTGVYSPPYDFFDDLAENQKIVAMIRAARPDLLFVGLGAPKQEKWIYSHMHELQVPVSIGVGASFEYVAQAATRAPRWMQRAGLEWLFRILKHPGRYWKRYVNDALLFFPLILQQRLGLGNFTLQSPAF
ncbi:MAG: WecB/TagA/CpsF family glycosyltransferase [bacterium]